MGTLLGGRALGGERPYKIDGFSGGGGHMQKSCRMRTRRSRPPSMVIISRIRGEVDVRYVRWVKELNNGSGEVVSNAAVKSVKIAVKIAATYLFCHIAGLICIRMPYSEPETQSWTPAWLGLRNGKVSQDFLIPQTESPM